MSSSVVADFSYEASTQELTITFRTGRAYTYFHVPAATARAFRGARSKGMFFNHYIRDRYDFRELPATAA